MKQLMCVLSSFSKEQKIMIQEDGKDSCELSCDNIDAVGEFIANYCNINGIQNVILGGNSFLKDKITQDIEDNSIINYNNKKIQVRWVK